MGNILVWGHPLPPPTKFLVFMELAGFCAQSVERVGVTGKIVCTMELGEIFWGWMGVAPGRWSENRA